jgi:HEAT repeat protein
MPESPDALEHFAPPDHAEAPRYRWRHHALEDILDRPIDQQPDWQLALQSEKQIVRVNAAIALSRQGAGSPEKTLTSAVQAPDLKLAVRRAATEALGEVHSTAATAALNDLIDQYSQCTGPNRSHYIPEIHAELVRALAHSSGGTIDARIVDALKSPAPVVKREALGAMTNSNAAAAKTDATSLPPLALDLTSDADPQVRIAALKLIAARKDPQALDKIHRALSDSDFSVRSKAIELLGQVGADEDRARLKRLAGDHGELVRVAAIQALANLDDRDNVESAAHDPSWRVRTAVVASLAKHPDRRSVALARQFLTDGSVEVQRATIRMTAAWQIETAGPLLLSVLDSPNYSPRKDAATLLSDRWAPAAGFPIDAPQQRRTELAVQLQQQWIAQFGNIDTQALVSASQRTSEISDERKNTVFGLINRLGDPRASDAEQTAAAQSLVALGADLLPILDALQAEHDQPLPARIYRDVLPQCGKEFELINQLADAAPANRRAALAAIVKVSSERQLSTVALARISELLVKESDPIQWLSAYQLIEHDPREPARLLAAAGMSHPSAEIRRRACLYFAQYPDAQQSDLLVAALGDDNLSVLHAAAQALGTGPPLADPAPLETLLTASDHSLRLDAAVSLSRWKLESGWAALERLAADDDPQIRRKTAQVIGKLDGGGLSDNPLLPTLVKLLDDQQDVRRAALLSLRSLSGAGNPPAASGSQPAAYEAPVDAGESGSATLDEQVQRWKQWYSRQNP